MMILLNNLEEQIQNMDMITKILDRNGKKIVIYTINFQLILIKTLSNKLKLFNKTPQNGLNLSISKVSKRYSIKFQD